MEHIACGLGVHPKLPSPLVELESGERCRSAHCLALLHLKTLSEAHRPVPAKVGYILLKEVMT